MTFKRGFDLYESKKNLIFQVFLFVQYYLFNSIMHEVFQIKIWDFCEESVRKHARAVARKFAQDIRYM